MSHPRWPLLISFGEKYTLLVLSIVNTMVLARVLTPADIGIYSVGAVLAGLAHVLRDFGVGAYVIQARELTAEKLRAALGASLAVAWALAAVIWLVSAPAAEFYREPRLRTVLQLLALNFVLIPFNSVTLPYLRRELRFGAIYAINTTHSVAQLVCSVALALQGYGYLSLPWSAVAGTVASLALSFCLHPRGLPWLPGLRGLREVLSFGAISTAGGMVDELGVAAPDLIIGKLIGLAEVGIFGKAMGVLNVFNMLVTSAISPVIFPLYARQARDGEDLRQAYLRTASYMTALAWPFFGFVAVTAPALVRLLYGDQWDAAIPLIRIICISSALYSIFSMARYLFVAMGEVKAQARLDAFSVPVRVAALLAAAPFGLEWVAWAVVLGALVRSAWTWRYLARLTGLGLAELAWALRRSALVGAASVAGALAAWRWLPMAAGAAASTAASTVANTVASTAAGTAAGNAAGIAAGSGSALPPLLLAGAAAATLWLWAILYSRHELAAECTLAGRKALALLIK